MELASEFKKSWEHKKSTSPSITNDQIDKIEKAIYDAGALSMKISGAGGGGFLMFMAHDRNKLRSTMTELGLEEVRFKFDFEGSKVVMSS